MNRIRAWEIGLMALGALAAASLLWRAWASDDRLNSLKDGLRTQLPSMDTDSGLDRPTGVSLPVDVRAPDSVRIPEDPFSPTLSTGATPSSTTVSRPTGARTPEMPNPDIPNVGMSQPSVRQEPLPSVPAKLTIPILGVRGGTRIEVPSLPSLGPKMGNQIKANETPTSVDLFVGYIVTISSDECPLGVPTEMTHPAGQVTPAGRRSAWGAAVRWEIPRKKRVHLLDALTVNLDVWQTGHPVGLVDEKSTGKPGISEYLGPSEEGYVYAVIPEEAAGICPDVRDRIKAVLGISGP